MDLSRSCSNVPRVPSFLKLLQNPRVLLIFDKVRNPLRLPRGTTSERPKVDRTCGVFNILTSKCASRHNDVHFLSLFNMSTSKVLGGRQFLTLLTLKCASRHNGVHFFDIATSKSAPKLRCFGHFDLEMCFAPQRRALFRHQNFQKWSPRWCVLFILTWKCASRHNGVQLFISHLTTWLRTRRFSEPTFRPSGATNHWKNIVFRDFPTFSRTCIFFLLTLSLLFGSSPF